MILLGTLTGGMLTARCPSREALDERPTSRVTKTLLGAYVTTTANRPLRSWRLGINRATPAEMAGLRGLLRYATQPLVFVSDAAAATNGLTPAQSALHPTTLPAGVSRGGMELVEDAWGRFHAPWSALTTGTAGWRLDPNGPPTPVVPGGPVTFSAALRTTPASPTAVLGLNWVNSAGVVTVGPRVTVTGSTTSPLARRHVTVTAPLSAVGCWLVVGDAQQVAAPAITLTPELRPYGEGDGAPEVVPAGDSVAHLLMSPQATYASHDLVLQEVGRAVW